MGELYLSKSLYDKNCIEAAARDFIKTATIDITSNDESFILKFYIISKDNEDYVIDEYCNYILGLMS